MLLDVDDYLLEPIVDRLLDKMNVAVSRSELKSLIFANSARTIFSDCIQATVGGEEAHGDKYRWEQTWMCGAITVPTLHRPRVGIARLKHPTNLGDNAEEIQFVVLVLCPLEIKQTKSALEIGRTFATLFSDVGLRHELLAAGDAEEFKKIIVDTTALFAQHQFRTEIITESVKPPSAESNIKWYHVGKGIFQDLSRRLPFYLDDFKDGVVGKNSLQKTVSTTLFLYFSVILPAVALGVMNAANTEDIISVQHVIVGQTLGALVFSFVAGQPLVVVMTTAPLAIFTKIIYIVSKDFEVEFLDFFAMVGIWNTFFLVLYSVLNMSLLMRFSSRSTEEIFSNFITIAFIVDSTGNMVKIFQEHYYGGHCYAEPMPTARPNATSSSSNLTDHLVAKFSGPTASFAPDEECWPDVCFLSLILMLGTVWLGVTLFEFTKRPFLNKGKRQLLSEYALPLAVVTFCLIGRVLFSQVNLETFHFGQHGGELRLSSVFRLATFGSLTVASVFGAAMLGFSLSLLFFMDQNISAAMVNSPDNRLLKGNAYHWDLLVTGLINLFLGLFGLPFLHAVLPHSPLHVKCLADTEERVEHGHVRSIVVRVRETRMTNILSNALIGASIFFLDYALDYIPTPVLSGLFLYLGVTALYGNQMFERVLLFFMEQSAYPPSHFIRRVPQRKVHTFTLCQLVQLAVLCAFGFYPWAYTKMIFPLVILAFLPVRHLLIPLLVEKKYLDVLDGHLASSKLM